MSTNTIELKPKKNPQLPPLIYKHSLIQYTVSAIKRESRHIVVFLRRTSYRPGILRFIGLNVRVANVVAHHDKLLTQ